MRSRLPKIRASLGVILILAMMTSGCGRRGRLLPPSDPDNPFALPAPVAKPAAGQTNAASSDVTKTGLHKRVPNPPITAPKQPFILDPPVN